MNYYEQFYDDLEFEEEEPHEKSPRYEEEWTHRDEMYRYRDRSPDRGHEKGHYQKDTYDDYDRHYDECRDYERPYDRGRDSDSGYRDEWEGERWSEQHDRDMDSRDRGWEFNDRGRAHFHRGRGFNNRGRDFIHRGRGFNDRGRGRGRGWRDGRGRAGPRGKIRGGLEKNFVKASEPTLFTPQTEGVLIIDESKKETEATTVPVMPVLPSYGYGPGSDFQEFGCASTGSQPGPIADPGVPGEDVPGVPPPQQVASSQAAVCSTEAAKVTQAPSSKVITAVVKPMYNFVKAQSEFKSTDVAFHESPSAVKSGNIGADMQQGRAGIGVPPGQKVALQSFDAVAAFHAKAKDGVNFFFDNKFNKLREAVKACSLPQKNAIEIIHMAVDKVKMKITDINNPKGRSDFGQAMFMCRLEIDGVFVGQGMATNKKSAKHEAYTNAKSLLDSGKVTVRETAPGLLELKLKEPVPVIQNITPAEAAQHLQPSTPANSTSSYNLASSSYNKPQIVFHKPNHPLANKPLEFAPKPGDSQQQPASHQSSASPGELAMKLLNFVKEGASSESQAAEMTKPPVVETQPKPGPSDAPKRTTPNQNMLKRALNTASAGNIRAKKARVGPVSLPDLSQFVIIDNSSMYPNLSDISILHASANHNKVVLKFGYEMAKQGFQCNTVIGIHQVSSCTGRTKEEAKNAAAKEALEQLREICYTVKVKQEVDNDMEGMTKNSLVTGDKQNEQIPDSNIGNMLLRKMGWSGGGVGKDGKGIAEPVKTEMVIGREGLGLKAEQGIGKDFNKNVTKMLTDYIKSDEQRDLHFSSELAKEERAVIHQIGQKLGLKTQSKGKGEDRYLIVSRKRTVGQLLDHVMGSGGSTDKYEVVPPRIGDVDPRKREALSHGHFKQ